MRAFAIESPGKMEAVELGPPVVGPEDVLLRIKVIGYCGSDLATYRGLSPLVTYPRVPGHEIGAVIESCGALVPAQWQPGMVVTCSPYTSCGKCTACKKGRFNACQFNQTFGMQREGALTEFVAVPWQKLFVAPGLTAAEHALVEPLAVGFHAVDRAGVQAGETVVVLGSGMIGLGAIASAGIMRDARVIAVDVDDRKLALAAKAGAAETINSSKVDLHERLQELTDGQGPDVVIEAVGLAQTFVAAVTEVCYAGRVVYIGYAKSAVSYETKFFILKELDIRGSRNSTPKDFEDILRMFGTGRYPIAETITRTVAMDEAGRAMAEWNADPGSFVKIHVQVD